MKFKIRKYYESDKKNIKKLLDSQVQDIALFNRLRKTKPSSKYSSYYLQKILNLVKKNLGIIIVSEFKKKLIGYCIGYIKEYSEKEKLEFKTIKRGFVSDLYVNKTYRNQGVGTQLIKNIEKYFKLKDCKYYEINVVLANKIAHSLYKKLGFSDHNLNMVKTI